jgi:hypothetical protein
LAKLGLPLDDRIVFLYVILHVILHVIHLTLCLQSNHSL